MVDLASSFGRDPQSVSRAMHRMLRKAHADRRLQEHLKRVEMQLVQMEVDRFRG